MTDKLRRALRGLLQYFTGSVLTSLLDLAFELSDVQTLTVAGLLGAIIAFVQNLLEDDHGMYAIAYPNGQKPA